MESIRNSCSGLIVLGMLALVATMAPLISTHDPVKASLAEPDQAPSLNHLFGTDYLGRDLFSRVLYGTRVSMLVGISAAALTVFLGLLIGLTAGYFGGFVDSALMRLVDVIYSPPETILLMVLVTIFERNIWSIILAIAFTHWMSTARLVRSETLSIRQRPFVESAISLGAKDSYIIFRHIMPNLLYIVVVSVTLMTAHAILTESFLSFLGLGIPPHLPSWGNMLNEAQRDIMKGIWWTTIFPGTMIVITVLSINLLGDELKTRLAPNREVRTEL
ncbi:MAG: nickel transporter permease NikC [Methanosaeta sp. PtaB.Bin018]|jgi:ABC-type dipeptide/oligopeptide/nickel transport system permease subunit|nr:MAG: nickel transporter permease NikC [Methanosaeta sp. PtaB.Bin018]OPY45986.1 MAG: nickel transporter permease NikC [Methanosaeta sp. PtaU1.Bin016]